MNISKDIVSNCFNIKVSNSEVGLKPQVQNKIIILRQTENSFLKMQQTLKILFANYSAKYLIKTWSFTVSEHYRIISFTKNISYRTTK